MSDETQVPMPELWSMTEVVKGATKLSGPPDVISGHTRDVLTGVRAVVFPSHYLHRRHAELLGDVPDSFVVQSNPDQAETDLRAWLSWARRSRLEPFKKLAKTLSEHFAGVISGMVDNRSNAFVEAMNGLLQQAKRAARGFRTADNFIAIAYLRMSKLAHLPAHPFTQAVAR